MPNLDGGHYFLTALLPIDNRGIVEHEGMKSSPIHMVREALETLPTALQSPAAEEVGIQSPFARSTRTHLARLVVIDQPFFNGRNPADSIMSAVKGTDLLTPQPIDSLNCPYLLLSIDFDPVGDEPASYLAELWSVAERELTTVFQYCYGFDAVKDPASFAAFVIPCQVETTMPFNDYWIVSPPFPSVATWQLTVPLLIALVIAGGLTGLLGWPWSAGVVAAIVLLAASLYYDYALIMRQGAKPFPAAPNATLRHVLKAIYLQQAFTRFALAQQGAEPAAVQAAFKAFVAQNRPDDLSGPTQPPGVVRSVVPEPAYA
jgi:hypothetical protein